MTAYYVHEGPMREAPRPSNPVLLPGTATKTELNEQLKADTMATLAAVREQCDPAYAWAITSQITWMSGGWLGKERVLREFIDGVRRDLARMTPRDEAAA